MRLATCRIVRLHSGPGQVDTYTRIREGPLNGPIPASRWWPVVRRLARMVPAALDVYLEAELGGGEQTTAWVAHVGSISVVVKMNQFVNPFQDRVVEEEWNRLREVLPSNAKEATALPIPSYHGGFRGEIGDIIVMSNAGTPLRQLVDADADGALRAEYERALATLAAAGIEAVDQALRNAVYDGRMVRVIDFV
ncbi:hypothetical protein BV20DRAFT_983989 [Pilatotrama ljubarskyi]|nr:hypothetical protein BV20DRAFT_983989 [Pilatotrama ljubarskyi]